MGKINYKKGKELESKKYRGIAYEVTLLLFIVGRRGREIEIALVIEVGFGRRRPALEARGEGSGEKMADIVAVDEKRVPFDQSFR